MGPDKKGGGKDGGYFVFTILSSKGENSPKFSILEAHMQSIHPEHVLPIFGT